MSQSVWPAVLLVRVFHYNQCFIFQSKFSRVSSVQFCPLHYTAQVNSTLCSYLAHLSSHFISPVLRPSVVAQLYSNLYIYLAHLTSRSISPVLRPWVVAQVNSTHCTDLAHLFSPAVESRSVCPAPECSTVEAKYCTCPLRKPRDSPKNLSGFVNFYFILPRRPCPRASAKGYEVLPGRSY